MWQNAVLPRLRSKVGGVIISRVIKLFGLAEAKVAEMVSPMLSSANPTLGVYAKADGIYLRLAAKARGEKEAWEMITLLEAELRQLLGEHIWGVDSDTLPVVVGRLLSQRKLTLAVMESYTGGLLVATLSECPEVAPYFKGGLVACSDEARLACGVDYRLISESGGESPEMAQAMAEVARSRLGAAVGLGVTGEDELSEAEKRLFGTFHIGIAYGESKRVVTSNYPGGRARVRHCAVAATLFELKKALVT